MSVCVVFVFFFSICACRVSNYTSPRSLARTKSCESSGGKRKIKTLDARRNGMIYKSAILILICSRNFFRPGKKHLRSNVLWKWHKHFIRTRFNQIKRFAFETNFDFVQKKIATRKPRFDKWHFTAGSILNPIPHLLTHKRAMNTFLIAF